MCVCVVCVCVCVFCFFFFQAEDGIRYLVRSRGLGDVYKRQVFLGGEYFNHYAEGLRVLGEPILGPLHFLLIARVVLVGSIAAHIWAATSLTRQAQMARPQRYLSLIHI